MRNKSLLSITLIGFVAVLVYFIPYFILGQNASIRVFDNLDGEIIYKMMAARKGYWLNYHALIPEIMNGLPRFCLTSGLNFTTLMFGISPPFIAYLANDFIMRIIGFIGIFLLMKKHIFKEENERWFVYLFSSAYIFIPFNTIYGLTDLGQPLLLYSYLNILKRDAKPIDYVCIVIFPFFSQFVLSGFFAGVALGIIWIYYWVKEKEYNKAALIILIGYAVSSLIVEYNLITPIIEGFHSHREEIIFHNEGNNIILFILNYLWETCLPPGQFFTFPIWIAVFLAFFTGGEGRNKIFKALSTFLIIYITINSLFFYNPSIKGFRLSRFYHLLPLCWMLLFGCALEILLKSKNKKWLRTSAIIIITIQAGFLWIKDTNYTTGNWIRNSIGLKASYNYPSYKSFFAENQFAQIRDFIGKPQASYRIINIGILPAVSQYNGFYTLDSYQNNYPLSYKHQFLQIEVEELAKNKTNPFYGFGNWCYIFPAEISSTTIIEGRFNKEAILHDLKLNHTAMKSMHCEYVLSSAQIEHCEKSGLRYLHCFIDPESHWDVWLYRVM